MMFHMVSCFERVSMNWLSTADSHPHSKYQSLSLVTHPGDHGVFPALCPSMKWSQTTQTLRCRVCF